MNILYCGLKYDYGKKEMGYSFEHLNFYNSLKNMSAVKKLDYICVDEILINNGKEFLNEEIIKMAKKNNYDFVFFFMFKDEIYKDTLIYLKKEMGLPTIAWMADDHWRFETYSKYWANFFTLVVTTDEASIAKYKKNKIENVILSQWGCNHFDYKPKIKNNSFDITFVGMAHGTRKKKIEYLKQTYEIDCWGNGWKNKKLSFEEMIEVYSNSRINLNFSESSFQKNFKTLIKIFISKTSAGNFTPNNLNLIFQNCKFFFKKIKNQIKGRVFEVPACAGFLLTENCENLEKYFEIDKEIVVFNSVEEAKDKIKFYKNNYAESKKIAENGYLRAIKDHTYEQRFLNIFKKLK